MVLWNKGCASILLDSGRVLSYITTKRTTSCYFHYLHISIIVVADKTNRNYLTKLMTFVQDVESQLAFIRITVSILLLLLSEWSWYVIQHIRPRYSHVAPSLHFAPFSMLVLFSFSWTLSRGFLFSFGFLLPFFIGSHRFIGNNCVPCCSADCADPPCDCCNPWGIKATQ